MSWPWLINGQEKIAAASKKTGARFLYEATAWTLGHGAWHVGNFWLRISSSKVGAGLPVIGPLQALVRAGDEVETASSQVKMKKRLMLNGKSPEIARDLCGFKC